MTASPVTPTPLPADRAPSAKILLGAALADIIAVLIFVGIGRSSHDEAFSFTGFATTAWPFLAGGAIGWLIVAGLRRADFAPAAVWPTGVVVWVCTVALGMGFRALSGQGTALSFCVVATIATGVLLLGWRAITALVGRRRSAA